tara:strand:- start:416 stop:748 length:333 start_codon:yes stop_codon:yes gene_type:complete
MCWYSDEDYKIHKIKTCMPLYSQDDGATFGWASQGEDERAAGKKNLNPTLEDFKNNGRYCKSGLAYPAGDNLAVCTSFTEMWFYDDATKKAAIIPKDKAKDGAYPCSPED